MKQLIPLLLAASIAILASCGKKHEYKTLLTDGDTVTMDSSVTIDDTKAGSVVEIESTEDGKMATFKIEDKELAERVMRVGVFRVTGGDTIALYSDEVTKEAESLEANALVPSKSNLAYQINKYATAPTLIAVGVGLVVLIILFFISKAVFKGGITLTCLALAAVTSFILAPSITPYIEEYLPTVASTEASSTVTEESTSISIHEVTQNLPKPQALAYIGVGLLSFFAYSLVIGSSLKRLHS